MRFILGFLSGILGLLTGWVAAAFLVISLAASDHDGGAAMAAFFQAGPLGGVVGFVLGVWLFVKLGIVSRRPAPPDAARQSTTGISRPFAAGIVVIACVLAWWGWYEFIRSPYLSHGFMTLDLQFRLSPGTPLPSDIADVQVGILEGDRQSWATFGEAWHSHDADRPVILASATLSLKTSSRTVFLVLPDRPQQIWRLDIPYDPDPTAGYSAWWQGSSSPAPVEMNYRLSADR